MKQLTIHQILKYVHHRKWPYPNHIFSFFQEWDKVLFFHWKVDVAELQRLLPEGLKVDLFDGEAWISISAFTMKQLHPRLLPNLPVVSNFNEVNVRTHVIRNDKPGIYLLNIEANSSIACFVTRLLLGLPYNKTFVKRDEKTFYKKHKTEENFNFFTNYTVGKKINEKADLDTFLTDFYCIYLNVKNKLYMLEVHHIPLELYNMDLTELKIDYRLGDLALFDLPDKIYYSPNIHVISWKKVLV